MAGGVESPALGIGVFAAVKFLGYSGFAYHAKQRFENCRNNFWIVGLARTVLGFVAGYVFYHFLDETVFQRGMISHAYLSLLPVRFLEWLLVGWLFFDRKLAYPKKLIGFAILGVAVTCLLDIPAIFGWIITSGFWIC